MKELKFRAWTDNLKDKWEMYYQYSSEHSSPIFTPVWYWLLNPTLKLMQYTWLKDKNWKEIYIWDILKVTKAYNSYTWMNSEIYWNYKVQVKEKQCLWFYLEWWNEWIYKGTEFEIIGNIYENPELLNNDK